MFAYLCVLTYLHGVTFGSLFGVVFLTSFVCDVLSALFRNEVFDNNSVGFRKIWCVCVAYWKSVVDLVILSIF